jgi:hypothetical protein
MYFNATHSCTYTKVLLLGVFLLFLVGVIQEVAALSWVSVDKIVFSIAFQASKYAISAGAKIVLHNPRIAALALAIYFRKEIFTVAKDTTGYLVGEYPYTSLLMVLVTLAYYSCATCDYRDNQEQENDDTE